MDAQISVIEPQRQSEYLRATWLTQACYADWAPEIVTERLDVPLSFVTAVTGLRSTVLAITTSVPVPYVRDWAVAESMCELVSRTNEALAISDVRAMPLGSENPLVPAGMVAYLGVPLRDSAGCAVGVLCAWDSDPRDWKRSEIDAMSRYADVLSDQLVRRELELELSRINRRVEHLEVVVPHEIRTPLTAIIGCLELLTDGDQPPPQEREWLLNMANRNGRRLVDFLETMPL